MGYRIQYNPEENKRYPTKLIAAVRQHWQRGIVIIVVLALGLAGLYNGQIIKTWLLPGDPEVTESAVASMVETIRAGEPVRDAVTAFCLEIMKNAQME